MAAWAREAGYDGIQLASSNAKLLDQFLSPFYNRRTDEFGGSARAAGPACSQAIRDAVAERAGADFTCTVKVPVGEKAPPFTPAHDVGRGAASWPGWCEEFGYDSVTPVEVSVFPDTTLSRGGVPRSIWNNKAIAGRFAQGRAAAARARA